MEYHDRNIPLSGSFTLNLEGDAAFVPYPTADMDTSHSTLTVRDSANGAKMPIASDKWAFGSCPDGRASLTPNATHICLFDGFRAERIYELIYPAKDPWVMGLGYAVTRDVASFLRYELRDDAGNPNPLALSRDTVGIRRAYGAGTSSTGMYMRDWLYLGFNEDEAHRKVFDAVQINIAGTHRLFANVEFSDPNSYSRQDVWHDSLSMSYPPLTFAVTTDPVSGIRDGILKRPATDPLVFQLDSGSEFWQMQASLNVHDGKGKPVSIPDNVRLYFASSFEHGGVAGPFSPARPSRFCEHMRQGSDGWSATNRALLVALDAWADRGVSPPKSRYPSIADGTLVSLADAARAFPKIPNVTFPAVLNELSLPDFGPQFGPTGGRLTRVPPTLGATYQVMVPKTDSDGLDLGGIRAGRSGGARCHPHRLEHASGRSSAAGALRAEWLVHPVCEDQGGAGAARRPAAIPGGTVRRSRRLRERGRGRGPAAGQGTIPAAGGRRPIHRSGEGQRRAALAGGWRRRAAAA